MRVAALIGEPATGKSTLAKMILHELGEPTAELRAGLLRGTTHEKTHVFGLYPDGETFGGTDRLSMAVQPAAENFISYGCPVWNSVFFEGDRLGNLKFINHCRIYAQVRVFVLVASATVKMTRHEMRGDTQKASFLSGRKTKIENILKKIPDPMVEYHASNNLAQLALARESILDFLLLRKE